MNLIPIPKHIKLQNGHFPLALLRSNLSGIMPIDNALCELNRLASPSHDYISLDVIVDSSNEDESYSMRINEAGINITAGSNRGVFYALQTLRQIAETEKKYPFLEISDKPDFPLRGILYDTTRGRVPTLDGLKKIADFCARLKLNSITLYFEHSLAFKEFEGIVSKEESLSPEELREFVDYCRSLYIDVIPSVALFGHQYKLLQSDKYKHLCELENYTPTMHYWQERMRHHSFDITNPDSFEVVKSFIDQLCDIFPYNIYLPGVDETFDLCKGRNKDKNVIYEYCTFVDKICGYLNTKGKTALIADDIIQKHNKEFSLKSENIIFFHWDYSRELDDSQFDILKNYDFPHISAPSVWAHSTVIESLFHSTSNIPTLIDHAYKHGSVGIINTIWGDYGHFCDFNCTLYGIAMGSAKSWNADTNINHEFDIDFSAVVYDEYTINMVDIIREINDIFSASGIWYWVRWYSSNILMHNNADFENPNSILAEKELIHSTECVDKLTVLKAKHHDKRELFDSLIAALKMCDVFNLLVLPITQQRKLADNDIKTIHNIIEEYRQLWLQNNKPGEFNEITAFVDGIISYIQKM